MTRSRIGCFDVIDDDESGSLLSVNFDLKNPNARQDFEHLPPEQLAEDILKKEQRIAEIMGEIKLLLQKGVEE